jgi:hypothetical protein
LNKTHAILQQYLATYVAIAMALGAELPPEIFDELGTNRSESERMMHNYLMSLMKAKSQAESFKNPFGRGDADFFMPN